MTGRLHSLLERLRSLLGREDSAEVRTDRSRGTAGGTDDPAPTRAAAGRPETPCATYAQMGMSPEEYLCQLIRWNGGRMWQQDLVEETGWSASSVSRRLSRLEETDRLCRTRVGRQKAVGFPGAMRPGESTTRRRGMEV